MRSIHLLPAPLAASALTACATDEHAATSRDDKAVDGALAFARCMRGEGLDFPDRQRDTNGLVRIGGPDVKIDRGNHRSRPRSASAASTWRPAASLKRDPAREAEVHDAS